MVACQVHCGVIPRVGFIFHLVAYIAPSDAMKARYKGGSFQVSSA